MAFKNIPDMLEELAALKFESEYVNEFIDKTSAQCSVYTEAQSSEIVRLFNVYCMPKRWEVAASNPAPTKGKRKKRI